jgi:hypothetical protein
MVFAFHTKHTNGFPRPVTAMALLVLCYLHNKPYCSTSPLCFQQDNIKLNRVVHLTMFRKYATGPWISSWYDQTRRSLPIDINRFDKCDRQILRLKCLLSANGVVCHNLKGSRQISRRKCCQEPAARANGVADLMASWWNKSQLLLNG